MAKKKKQGEAETEAAGAAEASPVLPSASIAAHPRAKLAIRRARSRAAFIVFLLVLLLGHKAGLSWFDATWRALVAGLAANLIAWRCAIYVWRHIIVSELRQAEEAYAQRRRAAREAAERRREAAKAAAENPDFRAA
jgi:small-conductance mechanosensitive channel